MIKIKCSLDVTLYFTQCSFFDKKVPNCLVYKNISYRNVCLRFKYKIM